MPNFNFKSQFPIAEVIQAAQKKPALEAEMQKEQEAIRQSRFKTLLDALSTGAQAARLMSEAQKDALANKQTTSQFQGQKDVTSILGEPSDTAPVAPPIQQFTRPGAPNGMNTPGMDMGTANLAQPGQAPAFGQADQSIPPSMPVQNAPGQVIPSQTVQPSFGATAQGANQQDRLIAALSQAAPDEFAKNVLQAKFGTGMSGHYKGFPRAVNYVDSKGQTRIGIFDPESRQIVRNEDTDPLAGFAQGYSIDPMTGMPVAFNRSTGTTNPVQLPENQQGPSLSSYQDLNPVQRRIIDETAQRVSGDKIMEGLRETGNNLNRLRGLLNSNDPASLGAIQSQMARAIAGEKGVLTDADVARNTGDRALASRFKRFIKTHVQGTLTDSDKKDFNQLLDIIDQKTQVNISRTMKPYLTQVKARIPNIDDSYLQSAINIAAPGASSMDNGGIQVDESAIDAEMRRRGLQ